MEQDQGPFEIGQTYRRLRDIHMRYGGQIQGGISISKTHPFVFLFSYPGSERYGYKDGWRSDGRYVFTGEGQRGDMSLKRGNKAIARHREEKRRLFLFEGSDRKEDVVFVGEFELESIEEDIGPDVDGRLRKILRFVLKRTS